MTETGLLLDTCAVLFLTTAGAREAVEVRNMIDAAQAEDRPLFLSPITAWEVGMLASKGRLSTAVPVGDWLEGLMSDAGIAWADMPPDLLIASSHLPGTVQGDPSDRIIIATARRYRLRIVTRDRAILDYAKRGHVLAVAC